MFTTRRSLRDLTLGCGKRYSHHGGFHDVEKKKRIPNYRMSVLRRLRGWLVGRSVFVSSEQADGFSDKETGVSTGVHKLGIGLTYLHGGISRVCGAFHFIFLEENLDTKQRKLGR